MTKSLDREILETLTKTLIALDRIQNALAPLLEKYSQQVRFMPDLPQGAPDCPACNGNGYLQYIDADCDLWTTKKCECVS